MITRRKFLARAGLFVPAAGLLIPRRGLVAQVGLRDPAFVALTKSQAAAAYAANASEFDGTNDYMTRNANLTGNADGKQGFVSFWFKLNGGDGANQVIVTNDSGNFLVYRTTGNKLSVAGGPLAITSSTSFITSSTWHHCIASWDCAATTARMYVDDALESTTTPADANVGYSSGVANYYVGCHSSFGLKLNGCISELCFDIDTYYDLSQASNRRLFDDGSGPPAKPVSLGSIGTSSILYLPNEYSTFQTNAGTGGNFTVTGALTTCTAP